MVAPDSPDTGSLAVEHAAPRRSAGRWPVVVLIVIHAVGLIALNGLNYLTKQSVRTNRLTEPLMSIWLATPFAQASLLAFWTGVSRRAAVWRFAAPLLPLLGICVVSFVWGDLLFGRSGVLPSGAVFVQWLVMSLIYDRVFRARGWRLRHKDDVTRAEEKLQLFQFGIKHLLVWTTLIAIMLAIGRVVVPRLTWDRGDLPGFALFGAFNCVYLIPLMALSLHDRRWAVGVLLSLAWTVLVTLAERYAFSLVYNNQDHTYLFGLNAVEAIVIVGSLLVVRAAGWRLMR